MASVASEASTVRHAHLGQSQGARGHAQSAEPADHTSPFTALLDGTSDTPPPPKSPSLPLPPPASQQSGARPHDGQAPQSASAEASPGTQKSPPGGPGSPGPGSQTGSASSPPSGPKGTDITAAALGALAKKAAKDSKSNSDANAAATIPNSATDVAAPNNTVNATVGSGTVAIVAPPDVHGGKTDKSDPSAADAAQAAAPPVDPTANQIIPVTPPVVVLASTPVIPESSTPVASGSDSGVSPDATQIAALSDSLAGPLHGRADRAAAEAAKSGPAASTPPTDSGTKATPKAAEAARSTPLLTPQPPHNEIIPASGSGQPNGTGAAPSGAPVKAASDPSRQRAAASQPNDGTAGSQGNTIGNAIDNSNGNSNDNPNGNPNIDPNIDPRQNPAVTANQIEDIARQALDKTARRVEAAAEFADGGTVHPDNSQAGSTPQSADGSGGQIAPATLSTAAAPAGAPATNVAPTAIPIVGLAVEIASHARAGKNRFEIRLDPPELGRINVRLDVDHDGKVTSRLVVDRQETLDMLRGDAPALEHALQQAGLKTADNALQFSLRDQGGFGGQNPNPNYGSPADAARVIIPDRELPPVEATTAAYGRTVGTRVGIDIRV